MGELREDLGKAPTPTQKGGRAPMPPAGPPPNALTKTGKGLVPPSPSAKGSFKGSIIPPLVSGKGSATAKDLVKRAGPTRHVVINPFHAEAQTVNWKGLL